MFTTALTSPSRWLSLSCLFWTQSPADGPLGGTLSWKGPRLVSLGGGALQGPTAGSLQSLPCVQSCSQTCPSFLCGPRASVGRSVLTFHLLSCALPPSPPKETLIPTQVWGCHRSLPLWHFEGHGPILLSSLQQTLYNFHYVSLVVLGVFTGEWVGIQTIHYSLTTIFRKKSLERFQNTCVCVYIYIIHIHIMCIRIHTHTPPLWTKKMGNIFSANCWFYWGR